MSGGNWLDLMGASHGAFQHEYILDYRGDVKMKNFLEELWDADQDCVKTPISSKVGDNSGPYW